MATWSIVRSMTNNCRLRFGIKRTNLRMRRSRNVRKTDNPDLFIVPSARMNAWHSSTALLNMTREKKR